ncbi:MAG: phage major capsid protein [Oscillospiraceae bacterium]|nr:phage major capsid protein [Oscillospiraceae bacterium]
MNKLKELIEKRSALISEMEEMVKVIETEIRAFTDEELNAYNAKKTEADSLTATINALREQRTLDITESVSDGSESKEQAEERAFVEYLRSGKAMELETRADSNWTPSENGAVIPSSIANKIIEKIVEISPIYGLATKYNVGGSLSIPYYDESTGSVTMEYTDEFTDGDAKAGKLLSITLGGYLARAICKVSKKLINNSQFDILSYVVGKVAEACVKWIDEQLINGTDNKIEGLSKAKQVLTTKLADKIEADELIELQDKIPDAYQGNAIWIMSRATRTAIRKLKDGQGNYLLNKDATTKWGYSLFGKPVYIADCIKQEAGKPAVYYGDFSGLAVKTAESVNIEVLREKYAEQHAVGVVAWLEMDAKIENDEKIAVLKMGGSQAAAAKA